MEHAFAAELLGAALAAGLGAATGGDSLEQAETSVAAPAVKTSVKTSMNDRCGILVLSYDGPLDSKSR
jgi:hypothetical protein